LTTFTARSQTSNATLSNQAEQRQIGNNLVEADLMSAQTHGNFQSAAIEAMGSKSPPEGMSMSDAVFEKLACSSKYRLHVDIRCYNAVGDGRFVRDASIEANSKDLNSKLGSFSPRDPGKTLIVNGASSDGSPLQTKILRFISSTQVELRDIASRSVERQHAYWATDSTNAFTKAWSVARRENLSIYIPPGSYLFDGPGLHGWGEPRIRGDGRNASTILLGKGRLLIDDSQNWMQLDVRGLHFYGGYGAVRNTDTNAADESEYFIQENYFENFTGVAISNNSRDNPYWMITKNVFVGGNTHTTIDIALAGGNDTSSIADNGFENYRVAIKLGSGGSNVHITRNGFLQFTHQSTPSREHRVAIWTIPSKGQYITTGAGLTVTFNKFGNEFMDPADFRVLYADEGEGRFFGDRLPLEAPTNGVIYGQTFSDNAVFGGGGRSTPFVYSYTPNVRNNVYRNFQGAGTIMGHILEFDPSVLQMRKKGSPWTNFCGSVPFSPSPNIVRENSGGSNSTGACAAVDLETRHSGPVR
jgi:hypothetical protein